MKRHSFSNDEIEANKSDPALWISFVRRREAEIVFGNILGGRRFQRGLELGAGNGEQSMVIKNYCDKLVSTDLNPKSYEWTGQTLLQRECDNVTDDICNTEVFSRYVCAPCRVLWLNSIHACSGPRSSVGYERPGLACVPFAGGGGRKI